MSVTIKNNINIYQIITIKNNIHRNIYHNDKKKLKIKN